MRHGVEFKEARGERGNLRSLYRLRVENRGLAKLVSPRVWCVAITAGSGKLANQYPFTAFEMNWAETDRDFQIGSLIPGRFKYRVDLGFFETAALRFKQGLKNTSRALTPSAFVLHRRNEEYNVRLLPGLPYDICLVISNENFLIPSHCCHLRVTWTESTDESSGRHNAAIEIIHQGDLWRMRLCGRLRLFEGI